MKGKMVEKTKQINEGKGKMEMYYTKNKNKK